MSLDGQLHRGRELVTHAIAVMIVFATLAGALWSFRYVGDGSQMEDAKALLAFMSGLSGVIIGYYFGRVPAESHASASRQEMAAAVADATRMKTKLARVDSELSKAEARAETSHEPTADDLKRLRDAMGDDPPPE